MSEEEKTYIPRRRDREPTNKELLSIIINQLGQIVIQLMKIEKNLICVIENRKENEDRLKRESQYG